MAQDAVTLTGSSEYAVPGAEFTLTCDVPDEANVVQFYRRHDVITSAGAVQVGSDQCYNVGVSPAVPCTPDVCSCVTSGGLGTVFRWIIQPQTGDHGSVWYCRRTNINLPNQTLDSDDYTLKIAAGPGNSISLSPLDTTYTRTEGDTLPDITCTADCRPGCTFVWTRPDNTNFTLSPVLSLGQLDRSDHGTYTCTARNEVGESSISLDITIQNLPYIVISPSTNPFIVAEGQTGVTLQCAATPTNPPVTSISWTKGSTEVSSTGIYNIPTITPGHAGVYTCSASNTIGTTTANITVQVILIPKAPKILGITNVSSSSLTLRWTPSEQVTSDNTYSITYSCEECDVTEKIPVDIENNGGFQLTTLTGLLINTQYYVNITSTNTIGTAVSAGLIAATATFSTCNISGNNFTPGTDTVSRTTQETASSTSIALTVVGVVLIVVAIIGFGVSVVVYRKGRSLCRSTRQQGEVQQPVIFSNILHSKEDTTSDRTDDRSHYQELDPKDIGKPSYYDITNGSDTGKNDAERGHYQEVDVEDIAMSSTYENTAGADTVVGHDGSRVKSTAVYSDT
ncbi:contactin-2-like [Pecten maximus]|uniref:contactin-2-like n=1 Tax=Pecten maximus TaxID=6579 RepID=UPI0014584415|nr:contactin-2-like [Pecten maximus]